MTVGFETIFVRFWLRQKVLNGERYEDVLTSDQDTIQPSLSLLRRLIHITEGRRWMSLIVSEHIKENITYYMVEERGGGDPPSLNYQRKYVR